MITALIIHWTFREAFACTAAEHYQQYNLLIINALYHRLWDCSSVITIVGNHGAKRKVERWPRVLKIVWRMMMMMMKQRHGWMTLLSSVDNDTVISWCQHYQHFLINIFYQHLSPPLSTAWGEHCWSLELCCWHSTLSWPVPRKGRGSSTRSGRISTGTMRSRRWASVTSSPRRASDCTR